jgi:hypothetical protein
MKSLYARPTSTAPWMRPPICCVGAKRKEAVNAPDIPRGRYKGERVGAPVTDEAEHFIRCPACGGGLIAANLLKCSSTKGRCRIRRRIGRNDSRLICRLPNERHSSGAAMTLRGGECPNPAAGGPAWRGSPLLSRSETPPRLEVGSQTLCIICPASAGFFRASEAWRAGNALGESRWRLAGLCSPVLTKWLRLRPPGLRAGAPRLPAHAVGCGAVSQPT